MAALFPSMVYVMDLKGRRAGYLDPGLSDMFGLADTGLTLTSVRRRLHGEDVVLLRCFLDEVAALQDHEFAETVLRFRRRCGDWALVTVRARPVARDRLGGVRRVMGVVSDVSRVHDMEQALTTTSRLLVEAEDTERRRIGRDLHDSTAQYLLAADLLLGALERRTGLDPQDPLVSEIRQSIGSAQREIRTFAYMLHPPELKDRGLEVALRAFCDGFARRTGLSIRQDVVMDARPLQFEVEVALFRIAQEALMNVHCHARATEVFVRLRFQADEAVLVVEDDGVGMRSAEMSAATAVGGSGVGIGGMRARLMQLGGSLSLESNGHGLILRVRAPIACSGRCGGGMARRVVTPELDAEAAGPV